MQTTTPNVNTVFTKDQEELLDYIADYTDNAFAEYFDETEDEQRLIDELSDIGIETQSSSRIATRDTSTAGTLVLTSLSNSW